MQEYYLPKGDGRTSPQGKVKEGRTGKTYDYFTLPLYVRENTILPTGDTEDRPDYDYEKNLTLSMVPPAPGVRDSIRPDCKQAGEYVSR